MKQESYFNVDMIPRFCNDLTVQQLIIRKMVFRKTFIKNEEENKIDNSIVNCNSQKLISLLSIFKLGKCKVPEGDPYGGWWNNYWWILLIVGGLGFLGMIIWRIWDCCDPKLEKTKRKFKKLKERIRKCCHCGSDNDLFIRDIENNITLDSNNLN
jgi:hypothetical protein